MSSSVEKIKEKLDVQDVIGSYIKVERAGGNFKANCPFHNEKTPSFFISPSRGTYYCFGCGAKGDIFTFVQEFEGTDFIGSLKILADRAGITLEQVNPKEKSESDRLHEVLELATQYFEKNLTENSKAIEYLANRGLTEETRNSWRIGYAPNEWRALHTYLKTLKVTDSELEAVGLIKRSEKTREDGSYDVFRGRIIFPIFDPSGKVIAFSGRIFDDVPDAPKYLNSPETKLFNKSETLYGFDRAKASIRKKDYSILVEGQMDLLMSHQAGFSNTVASSGTAFTEAHLIKLGRLSSKILFVYDSDSAGFHAALKSGALALSLGMEVKLAQLPKGTDPAELILKDENAWIDALKNSKHLIDFYLDNLVQEKLDPRKLAKEVEKKVLPYVSKLKSSIEQSHYVSLISKRTGIREDAIWNDLRRIPRDVQVGESTQKSEIPVEKETRNRKNYIVRKLLGIVYWQEALEQKNIDPQKLRIAFITIAGEKFVANAFQEFDNQKEELIFEAEAYFANNENLKTELEELLLNLEEDILKERFVQTMGRLEQAEHDKDEKVAKDLLNECQTITQQLAELSKRRIKE